MIIYLENPKNFSRKLLELLKEFSKVSRYKINIHILVALLYTNSNQAENQINNSTPFIIAANNHHHNNKNTLGIYLTKEAKDLYKVNHKTVKINHRQHKQMAIHPMQMVGWNQNCENDHTAKSNLKIQCNFHQATIDFLHRTGKNHHELHKEPKESPHSQVNSKQKTQRGASHYRISNYTTRLQ